MSPAAEKRLLQTVMVLALFLPLAAAAMGVLRGPAWLNHRMAVAPDLDSHFRYLSGIFLMLLLGFASCVPGVEHKGSRFRLLGALVIAGGCARLVSLLVADTPSMPHLAGLGIELGLMPLLLLWQARVARRYRRAPSSPGPASAVGA